MDGFISLTTPAVPFTLDLPAARVHDDGIQIYEGEMTYQETITNSARSSPGLLTFLIADVRGYTKFTNEHGDEAAARLADRFAGLVETVVADHEGRVIELRGDEALSVFPSARDALQAGVALQETFRQAVVDNPSLPLNVGIGLDAGEPIPVRGGYRGGALNLAARLCSIAAAGEILASEGVIHLARKTEGLVFVDRGQVWLKGLTSPVRVLQIAPVGELPEELPPLQPILVTHPTNLPDEPTPFVGREAEIDQVVRLLRDPHIRMVTLTGTGGTGKTRLALQVGSTLLHDFADGVFFVSLAPLADPSLIPSAIADVLSIKEEGETELVQSLSEHLADKHLLLVLDNFEHLLDAAGVVANLLDGCRDLHILLTSRIPLHLSREQEHAVPPLSVPDPKHVRDAATLSQYESVALFIQRAKAVQYSFTVTDDNAPAVAEICHRLDGLPLAIELAAARIKLFPPQALLQRLSNRLKLLTGGAKDRPSRQQTLRGAIDWSYSLLTEQERILFARLSVFTGGWAYEASEAVCNPDGDLDLLEDMASLVDKSLVKQTGEDEPRFAMLETIREYAEERLAERGEGEEIARQHAEYYMSIGEESIKGLWGPESAQWFARLELERDNFRAALGWARAHGRTEIGLRTARSLLWFWKECAYYTEGRGWLEGALATEGEAAPRYRAAGLYAIGVLDCSTGNFGQGEAYLEESARVFGEIEDVEARIKAVMWLGTAAALEADFPRATRILEEALVDAREFRDEDTLNFVLQNLGSVLVMTDQPERALPFIEEALEIARGRGDMISVSGTLEVLATVKLKLGDVEGATRDCRQGLVLARDGGFKYPIPYHFEGLAGASAHRGDGPRAVRLLAAADSLRTETGALLLPGDRGAVDAYTARARLSVDGPGWEAAWNEGQMMTLERAMAYALEESD